MKVQFHFLADSFGRMSLINICSRGLQHSGRMSWEVSLGWRERSQNRTISSPDPGGARASSTIPTCGCRLLSTLQYFNELLDHSNIFNYMPKYIIVFSCVALHSPFVFDKISFAAHFSNSHREIVVPTNFHVMEIPALLLTGQM